MALQKLSEPWNGIVRSYGSCSVETSYSVYADMTNSNSAAYIQINGVSIYASTQEILASAIDDAEIVFTINGGTYTFSLDTTPKFGGYSPSGNWMPYFVIIISDERIEIPSNGQTFQIAVSINKSNSTVLSFTESCVAPVPKTVSTPNGSMVTGRVYQFNASSQFQTGTNYVTTTSLSWRPVLEGVYTTQVFESGYVDPYTKTSEASSGFSAIYFAVPNPDHLVDTLNPASGTASIVIKTKYLSSDFVNGILITDLHLNTIVEARADVDADLKPILTSSNISITVSPITGYVNEEYVHGQATLTCTPNPVFKYGDTILYIHTGDGANRYTGSISFPAIGVKPGEEYIRPDTGETEVAGEESVRDITISVVGSKWGIESDEVQIFYTVLYYHIPRLDSFSVHRASVSTVPTDYQYNGTYYKKNDFGEYCIILYEEDYSELDGENELSTTIQYGTHAITVPVQNNTPQCVVVSANTESAMDVIITQFDMYYPYGVSTQLRLSTANILIDFLANGKGMAVGKAATETNALDIASNWKLLFYNAAVGAYSGNSEESLVPWMHEVDRRLSVLETTEYANG